MENDGRGYVFLPLLNYANQNYDHIHEMFQSENTVLSLSDGGAHCGVITDTSTYFEPLGARPPVARALD